MAARQRRNLCYEPLEPRSMLATLFDGGLGTTPDQQGWLYLTDPMVGATTRQTVIDDAVLLDSTIDDSEKAGYFATLHPGLDSLDRFAGYHLHFQVQLVAETHASQDRAGLSVIVLSQDLAGIELGFWEDRVWAQDDAPLFVHAEEASADLTEAARYDLYVDQDRYTLLRDQQFLLTGALRDYSRFGAPYDRANLVFVGDDTSSAAAATVLKEIGVAYGTQPVLCVAHQGRELSDGEVLDFGPLPLHSTDARETLTVSNEGSAPWFLDDHQLSHGFETLSAPHTFLLAGESTEWSLGTDTGSTGARNGLLTIDSNDRLHPEWRLSLRGYVHAGPAFQNPQEPLDVNDDGEVAPGDAIRVISYLNRVGLGAPLPRTAPPAFLDVNGDDAVSAVDAILVVNDLNRRD